MVIAASFLGIAAPLFIPLIGIAGALLGGLVNSALATREKVSEEMRQLRLTSYPALWKLTGDFSRWPRMTNTYVDLDALHGQLRSWYYDVGGLHLSENSRARYGDVQALMDVHLRVHDHDTTTPAQADETVSGGAYESLMDACSALRLALTEDLESRKQRSVLQRIRLLGRHWWQKRQADRRLKAAKREGGARP